MTAIATDRSYFALQDIQARVGAMDHPIITYTMRSHPDGMRDLWPVVWRSAQCPAGWMESSIDGGETWTPVPPGSTVIPRTVRRRKAAGLGGVKETKMTQYPQYIVVVACMEAGSGDARWHAALGVMMDGAWIDSWDPSAPPNRAGDYPHEARYEVVPSGGRYQSAGVRGVPAAHVEHVAGVLDHARVNPHCPGWIASDNNWIDADVPADAVAAATEALRADLLRRADEVERIAARSAAALRADAAALH